MNARASSHVGKRPADRTSASVGAAASRSDSVGADTGQSMPSVGSRALMVCSRSGE